MSLRSCATRGTVWLVTITERANKVLITPLFGRRVIMILQNFCMNLMFGCPLTAAPYRSYVQGPSGVDHCNLYVRLEHLTSDIVSLEEHLGFRIDVGHVNASARDQDYRAYYTNDLSDHVARICADDIARFEYAF